MSPTSLQRTDARTVGGRSDARQAGDEVLCLRNYDDHSATVTVALRDADDEVVFRRAFGLAPNSALSVSLRLDRGVYQVSVARGSDDSVRAECLLGGCPGETALVEVGNGLASVAERGR